MGGLLTRLLPVFILATLGWAQLLVRMSIASHKYTASTRHLILALSAFLGACTAILLGLGALIIIRWRTTPPPPLELAAGETTLMAIDANHFLSGEARGGRLLVTDRRLAFRPHRFNFQMASWSAPWESIAGFMPGTIPNTALVDRIGQPKPDRLTLPRAGAMVVYLELLRGLSPAVRVASSERLRALAGLAAAGARDATVQLA